MTAAAICSRCHRQACTAPDRAPGAHLSWCCEACATAPLLSRSQVLALHKAVNVFLGTHLGLHLDRWLTAEQVQLVSPAIWPSHQGRSRVGEARLKVLRSTEPGRRTSRTQLVHAEVCLLRGLPVLSAASVLAHEAFHVYSAYRGLSLSVGDEEGTANLWGYLLLAVHPGSQLAERERLTMLHDPDEVYGRGFRTAREAYKRSQGFADYLQRLAQAR